MMTDKWTYRWLWSCLIAGGLLLSGCSDSHEEDRLPEPDSGPSSKLELKALTRTGGAMPFTGDIAISSYLISATNEVQTGDFTYSGTAWTSGLTVKEEKQYYLYGYMPKEIKNGPEDNDKATITQQQPASPLTYADGIDISMTDLPAITTTDICVVVGVQHSKTATETATVNEGEYGFVSGINNQNYVNLLMAHLYSGLELSFNLDADYAKLRSIHVKTVTLSFNYQKVNATVRIRKGQGIGSPTFEATGSSSVNTFAFLTSDIVLSQTATSALSQLAYCAPCVFTDNTELTITSTYDVYDNNNVIIRPDQTSVNKLKPNWTTDNPAAPGKKKTITLTVKPTYLYVLSDNDLDNPVISLSSN